MAEGGPEPASADPSSVDNTDPSDSCLLDCPVCLEQLRQPKSLPCHHSLCEECLSSYIISEVSGTSNTATSFTCPVCRTLTHPLDSKEDKDKWAKQFPDDGVAVEMIQMKSGTAQPYYCMPCQNKGKMTTSAQFWCKGMQCLFCLSCKVDFHDMIHKECDIIDITESRSFSPKPLKSERPCDKHKEKMDFYCVDHKSLGCSKCITVDHRKCEEVVTTEDYCKKLEDTSRLEDMMKSLQQGAEVMETLIKDFYLHLQNIADDKDTALKSIEDLHERINTCIKEMKKEITDDLVRKYKEGKEKLKLTSQKCERLKVAIQKTLESFYTAMKDNNHMETILLYQRGQAEVESCKNLVQEMRKSLSAISIKHETDLDLTRLGRMLDFGKIVVITHESLALSGTKAFAKPLSECKMKVVRKMSIKCPTDQSSCLARGVVYLDDDRIVVSDDSNKKIVLVNTKGVIVDELRINGIPNDMCKVDNTTVAAAVDTPGSILILTVTPYKLTVSSELNTDIPCYGIAYRDGEFIVGSRSKVFSVTRVGTKVMTRELYSGTDTIFALSDDTKHGGVFTTHHTYSTGSLAVGKLSADNKHSEVLKVGVVKLAYGVDVDVEGNVYVCGRGSNKKVVQISGDGTNIRELLTEADGMVDPMAISVCGDKLVATNTSINTRNYITLFQFL